MQNIDILTKRLNREKVARKEAENILEKKSREIYEINCQLREMADVLAAKEEKNRLILEASADGIVLLDENKKIVSANPAAAQLFGYMPADLMGTLFFDLVKDITHQKKALQVNELLDMENALCEALIPQAHQDAIPIELSISKKSIHSTLSIICVLRKISARKETEQYLSLQHMISRVLVDASSVVTAIHSILQRMCEILHMQMGNMWEIDQSKNVLRLYDSYYLNDPKLQKFYAVCQRFTFAPGIGLPGRVYQSSHIHQIYDVMKDNNFPRAPHAEEAGLHSAFAVPLFIENRVMGVLEFFSEKTKDFNPTLLEIISDIGNQIGIFLGKEQTRKNMLSIQRVAGIAEVTTGMLHNVGNVLNSVNISVSVLENTCMHSKLSNLLLLRDILKSHQDDFSEFVANTKQGKHLPSYLIELANYWEKIQDEMHRELESLTQGVQHINDILKSQQSLSASFGMVEPVQLNLLADEAVRINSFTTHLNIKLIQKEYVDIPPILTDRIKLLQILVNLVRNAIQAIEHNVVEKTIKIKTELVKNQVCIRVIDNGYGIEKSNLIKIFTRGFSTKQGGHGFGLHASALFAQEMGGSLKASSDGAGKGATFTLILPMKLVANNNNNHPEKQDV